MCASRPSFCHGSACIGSICPLALFNQFITSMHMYKAPHFWGLLELWAFYYPQTASLAGCEGGCNHQFPNKKALAVGVHSHVVPSLSAEFQ